LARAKVKSQTGRLRQGQSDLRVGGRDHGAAVGQAPVPAVLLRCHTVKRSDMPAQHLYPHAVEGGADRGGLCSGDDEDRCSMGAADHRGKRNYVWGAAHAGGGTVGAGLTTQHVAAVRQGREPFRPRNAPVSMPV
jgi:hypothetical protein